MTVISLVGAASYMPERIVTNEFFLAEGEREGDVPLMFRGVKQRHHGEVGEGEGRTEVELVEYLGEHVHASTSLWLAGGRAASRCVWRSGKRKLSMNPLLSPVSTEPLTGWVTLRAERWSPARTRRARPRLRAPVCPWQTAL